MRLENLKKRLLIIIKIGLNDDIKAFCYSNSIFTTN